MKRSAPTGITEEMLAFFYDDGRDSSLADAAFACDGYCACGSIDGGEELCAGLAAVRKGVSPPGGSVCSM